MRSGLNANGNSKAAITILLVVERINSEELQDSVNPYHYIRYCLLGNRGNFKITRANSNN